MATRPEISPFFPASLVPVEEGVLELEAVVTLELDRAEVVEAIAVPELVRVVEVATAPPTGIIVLKTPP
jgi:hypothetical protein